MKTCPQPSWWTEFWWACRPHSICSQPPFFWMIRWHLTRQVPIAISSILKVLQLRFLECSEVSCSTQFSHVLPASPNTDVIRCLILNNNRNNNPLYRKNPEPGATSAVLRSQEQLILHPKEFHQVAKVLLEERPIKRHETTWKHDTILIQHIKQIKTI